MLRQFKGKEFRMFMPAEEIQKRIKEIGGEITEDYQDRNPVFLGILNGCFMFAGDLFKYLEIDCTITFVKLASYKGTTSTGNVLTAIGLEESLHDKDIIIIEDIVDTGNTMVAFLESLKAKEPRSIRICTLFSKPEVHKNKLHLDYVGFDIPNKFILGYGLDYDGLGRNLPDLYKIVSEDDDVYRFSNTD